MSSYSSIYYFMMGNFDTHKEIGCYINDNLKDSNFENIKFTCDDIFTKFNEEMTNNKKFKKIIDYYIIHYTLKNSGTFYLTVVLKNSLYSNQEHLIYELFEDIEHQGIKKLVDKNGELTRVGKQNLKFCIDLFQENNRKGGKKDQDFFFMKNKDKEPSKIALLTNEINEIQNSMKEGVKNLITNINEMNEIDEKSGKIKDTSYQFQKDSADLEQKMKFRKLIFKVLIYSIFILIFTIILYLIFK